MCIIYNNEEYLVKLSYCEFDTFQIYIKAKNYTGKHNFSMEIENLIDDFSKLQKIYNNLSGSYTINDRDSDSFLLFKMKQYGKMRLSGQLGGSHTGNYLVFDFEVDQTLLTNFLAFIESIIKNTKERGGAMY